MDTHWHKAGKREQKARWCFVPGTLGCAFPLLLAAEEEHGDSEELATYTGAAEEALVGP